MSELPNIDFSILTKSEKYHYFHASWPQLWDNQIPTYANLNNVYAFMRQLFEWWWVGNYWVQNHCLKLGAFQGDPACTIIDFGKGVCGTCWRETKSIVVSNVHEFPGHIACSSSTNSEIVVPIFNQSGKFIGVLDVDSVRFNDFDDSDRIQLELFCSKLAPLLS